jgi:hypothetical protein
LIEEECVKKGEQLGEESGGDVVSLIAPVVVAEKD